MPKICPVLALRLGMPFGSDTSRLAQTLRQVRVRGSQSMRCSPRGRLTDRPDSSCVNGCALLAPEMRLALHELETPAGKDWSPLALAALLCRPFLRLDRHDRVGHEAIKFMARLTWQEGGEGQLLLVRAVQPYFARFLPALHALNPDKPLDALTLQIYLAVNTLIHGLADASLLTRSPAAGVERLRTDKPALMEDYFIAYIAGGLCSPAPGTSSL